MYPDVHVLTSKTPLPILNSLIETFQIRAKKEFNRAKLKQAEKTQIEVITHLEEREASYNIPFDNRMQMQQFLAEIYIKNNDLQSALSIMSELVKSESNSVNERDSAAVLIQACYKIIYT